MDEKKSRWQPLVTLGNDHKLADIAQADFTITSEVKIIPSNIAVGDCFGY